MHGGHIRAHSDGLGKGTVFEVVLPAQDGPRPADADGERPHPANERSLRVLVVDDNRDVAQSMGKMLEMLGHDVRVEYAGASAIQASKTFTPDVVLLDIGMPGMNGYDVCRTIKEDRALRNTVVVAQTGWAEAQHGSRSQDSGFDHHLVKPVHLKTLEKLLSSIAGGQPR